MYTPTVSCVLYSEFTSDTFSVHTTHTYTYTCMLVRLTIISVIEYTPVLCVWNCIYIVGFVKGDQPKQFPTLQVRYKKGANPTLKLLDDTNTVQDTLA